MSTERSIFRQGSTTFFTSSLFLPGRIRQDVFDLYSFVRVVDDLVDQVPSDKDGFYHLRSIWERAVSDENFSAAQDDSDEVSLRVVKNMLRLQHIHRLDGKWIEAFLDSMQMDVIGKHYKTLDDTLEYIYGSAEVIGLMMARIMDLPPEAEESARLQGRALQMINFIRDIDEDNQLGRQYFPQEELKRFNLPDLTLESATAINENFIKFVHFQIDRYETWQNQAAEGYTYIPKRLRVSLKTAADMYAWTAAQIRQSPHVVYEKKIKPSKSHVVLAGLRNLI